MYLFPPDRPNPRSLFAIYFIVVSVGLCGIRMLWQSRFKVRNLGEPIAIYGAGTSGQQLVHMLKDGKDYRPAFFIDNDISLLRSTIAGLPVAHPDDPELPKALERQDIGRIIMAIPSLDAESYRRRVEDLQRFGLPVQTIPRMSEIISGVVAPDQIRDISVADILGRNEVVPDIELLARCVAGKVVMVTGGGGSIGSELCRQILAQSPARLVVVDNAEANLYQITEELEHLQDELKLSRDTFAPELCSVTDRISIDALMLEYGIEVVYHAAAYKHVPIIERHPERGVEVNVFGTLGVLESAIEHGVENFILVSTDKAVRPTNAMGASKRAAELVLQAKAREGGKTRISMVRFGNVLGSSGSVVPKFRKQIEAGGPITLTHRDITRYFMTIPEAAQLVLQASAINRGGEVFVLDMGEQIRILDLARTMVRLMGRKLREETGREGDIDIVIEGLRPGEKMFEEMFLTHEHKQTQVAKVLTADEVWLDWSVLRRRLDVLRSLVERHERQTLRESLVALAFEAQYAGGDRAAQEAASGAPARTHGTAEGRLVVVPKVAASNS